MFWKKKPPTKIVADAWAVYSYVYGDGLRAVISFDVTASREQKHVGYDILSVVSAVRWYCVNVEKDMALEVWLPHETPQGAPPRRKLKAFLFHQVKPIWEWCSDKRAAYPTRFLTANNIKNYGSVQTTGPVSVRPLDAVMDELLIGQTEYQMLRNRYGGK